uniref:LAGLIDADG endonuclease n=1 Tax=Ceratocystis albifundus TaxID=357446 RepID=A0A5P9W8B9_9PEZI|nr:LAGLIDADG endonuclease [Ceratocystis albifundus]QFX74865.1 LAGLIDADG endonuclease [Ceratocystis albifundus]
MVKILLVILNQQAICPSMSGTVNAPSDNKQSASETTRKTSFNFTAFRDYYNTFFKNSSQLSDDWLEGDGAIQTYANGTRMRFVLTQKESLILYGIKNKWEKW